MEKLRKFISEMDMFSFGEIYKTFPIGIDQKQVISEFKKIKNKIIKSAVPQENKTIIHMAGIPGSGKSTYCQTVLLKKFKKQDILYLGFDAVMEEISHYKIEKEKDAISAFKNWEIPSRILGYEILCEAFDKNLSILFDNGATFHKHIQILECFKKENYKLVMYYLGGTPNQLVGRIKNREKVTKRHFPENEMIPRYNALLKNLEVYYTLVDEFHEVKNIDLQGN